MTTEWSRAKNGCPQQSTLGEREGIHSPRDDLSRQRRDLPWEKVDKRYMFDGPTGKESLPELFENRSQLIVDHLMFSPDWMPDARTARIGPTASTESSSTSITAT